MFLAKFARLACAVGALCGVSLTASAASFSQVIAFGDSLTDTGNFFARTSLVLGPANAQPQAQDYFNGRFSNGPAAVEVLAAGLGVGLQNYAFGGATTSYLNGAVPSNAPDFLKLTGLLAQVDMFKATLPAGTLADPNALYFVWAGANDIRYNGAAGAPAAIDNLVSSVSQLYALGARDFMLPLLPDLGITPEGLTPDPLNPLKSAQTSAFSVGFNTALVGAYSQLQLALPDLHYVIFDTLAAQRAIVEHPDAFGFNNVTDACFTGYIGVPGTKCATPDSYLFWDKVHPTAATNALLGGQMLAAAVPEPETVAMMASGLLLLAGAVRRRNRAAAATAA